MPLVLGGLVMAITQQAVEIAQRWPVTAEVVQALLDSVGGDTEQCELFLKAGAAWGFQERYSLAHGRQATGADLALAIARFVQREQP